MGRLSWFQWVDLNKLNLMYVLDIYSKYAFFFLPSHYWGGIFLTLPIGILLALIVGPLTDTKSASLAKVIFQVVYPIAPTPDISTHLHLKGHPCLCFLCSPSTGDILFVTLTVHQAMPYPHRLHPPRRFPDPTRLESRPSKLATIQHLNSPIYRG